MLLWLFEDGAGAALGAEVGLGEMGGEDMERMFGVDVEEVEGEVVLSKELEELEELVLEVDGVRVLSNGLDELVLELDGVVVISEEVEELMIETAARTVDDLETSVITVIVE